MTNKQNIPIKLIHPAEREWREKHLPRMNWKDCTFCGVKPTTHITSEGDFVCKGCCEAFEKPSGNDDSIA